MHLPISAIVLLSLLFSFLAAVGVNLQKLSMAREEEQHAITSRPPYFQPIWLIGLSVIVLDGIGDFIFIGMAPQSLLVPLGALSLGFNCLLAPFFHNEVITRGILLSTAIVYCGTIVTVLYAPKENEDYTLMNLRDFATTVEFLWFELFNVCFLTITYGLGTMKGFGAGMYCALAGCFGGQTLLLAKCLSELLLNALFHDDWVDWKISPAPYLMAMGMVGTLVTQLHFLNTGLHKFEALRVGPLYQCFFICFGITGGLIFFQEYHSMIWKDIILYSIGIIILIIGVAVLVHQRVVAATPVSEVMRDTSNDSLLEYEIDPSEQGVSIGHASRTPSSDDDIKHDESLGGMIT